MTSGYNWVNSVGFRCGKSIFTRHAAFIGLHNLSSFNWFLRLMTFDFMEDSYPVIWYLGKFSWYLQIISIAFGFRSESYQHNNECYLKLSSNETLKSKQLFISSSSNPFSFTKPSSVFISIFYSTFPDIQWTFFAAKESIHTASHMLWALAKHNVNVIENGWAEIKENCCVIWAKVENNGRKINWREASEANMNILPLETRSNNEIVLSSLFFSFHKFLLCLFYDCKKKQITYKSSV